MKEIVKQVEITYGNLDDLVEFVVERISAEYRELYEKDFKKLSFKRRGTRRLEITALQLGRIEGKLNERFSSVLDFLRGRRLKPAGVWELMALVPIRSVYAYSSISEGFAAQEAFKNEYGEDLELVGLGHATDSWLGPQYANVQRSSHHRTAFSLSFSSILIPDKAYYVGYREIR